MKDKLVRYGWVSIRRKTRNAHDTTRTHTDHLCFFSVRAIFWISPSLDHPD